MGATDTNTPWSTLLVDRLAAAGVREIVVSPGSRSTPLVIAAAREPRLRLHTVIDERSAAFFAVGQARVTRRPTVLVCTSGSAAAHYYPAVIEASESGLPLLVLTADRPPELQHRAAPQAIDQVKLFGGHVRRFFDLGGPTDDPEGLAGLGGTVALAVATSLAPSAGPVHLNAWFRKPFEPRPEADWTTADRALQAAVEALRRRPATRRFAPRRTPRPEGLFELLGYVSETRRGLIVCGPAPLLDAGLRPGLERFATLAGYPLFVEATSQQRFAGPRGADAPYCDHFDLLLRSPGFLDAHPPELIVQVGAPPTSAGYERMLAAWPRVPRWIVAAHGWNDPYNQATAIIAASLAETVGVLGAELERRGVVPDTGWVAAWRTADARAADAVAAHLAAAPASEAAFVRGLVERLPEGALLMLGNSLPVREVDTYCPGGGARLSVLSQRGANGIDGLLSGAAGAATVAPGPVVLLAGDVAFLHDVGGLAACAMGGRPLSVVVVNNGGGRLFELLPVAGRPDLRELFDAHFLTPPGLDIGAAARAFGLDHVRVTTPADLAAIDWAPARPQVVEVVVRDPGTRAFQAALDAAVSAAVRDPGGA